MSIMLDVLGSFIVAGLLLMAVISTNAHFSQYTMESTMDLSAQESLVELSSILQYDLRKIGYRVLNPQFAIIAMDSTSLAFWGDIDNDGLIDSVAYTLGDPDQMGGTSNPNDRRLYRRVGENVVGGSLGLTNFRLRYFDLYGLETTFTELVKGIEVSLEVESSFPLDSTYSHTSWKGVVYPMNLNLQ